MDRWFPSSKTCSGCGGVHPDLGLGERTCRCTECRLSIDRDLNAAINLTAWADKLTSAALAKDRQAGRPVTNACRQDDSGQRPRASETSLDDAGTRDQTYAA